MIISCVQWFKDTKLKANHNLAAQKKEEAESCVQWFKDTKLKANHNVVGMLNFGCSVVSNGSKILN